MLSNRCEESKAAPGFAILNMENTMRRDVRFELLQPEFVSAAMTPGDACRSSGTELSPACRNQLRRGGQEETERGAPTENRSTSLKCFHSGRSFNSSLSGDISKMECVSLHLCSQNTPVMNK